VALGKDLLEAYERAYSTDPESAFGGIIAFNGELDEATARTIVERQFVEVIVAPRVSGRLPGGGHQEERAAAGVRGLGREAVHRVDFKRVNGGLLVQDADLRSPT
jgi:phosphoribosylaminoimidazolecarboxamide formyltransferase / IMP cyclohydrolase